MRNPVWRTAGIISINDFYTGLIGKLLFEFKKLLLKFEERLFEGQKLFGGFTRNRGKAAPRMRGAAFRAFRMRKARTKKGNKGNGRYGKVVPRIRATTYQCSSSSISRSSKKEGKQR